MAAVAPSTVRPGPPSHQASGGPSLQIYSGSGADLSENRRLVTVLFADLSGSTALAERLDPEELRSILTGYFGVLSRQIQRFGGTVDKYIGDAVMAVFGAPVAHEDDAERAINAALAMQSALGQLNDDLEHKHGVRLALRIGVNTGEVVAGLLAGDVQGAYTVVGDTVNTAQRFESAAPLGGILVSEPTWRLTRRLFEFEAIAALDLKGKTRPQPAYRALRPRLVEVDNPTTPLIGRASELKQLNSALASAIAGRGGIVHVVGDAGVGKSRLLREFRLAAEPEVVQVVARCASFEVDTPYALIARLLRAVLQILPGASAANATTTIEQLLATFGTPPDSMDTELLLDVLGYGERSSFDPQSKRHVLLALLRRLLTRHTQREPLLIVAEDLHWSDAASCGLLAELNRDLPARHGLLVSTSRPGWEPPWSAQTITLQVLRQDGARSLVEAAFGQPVENSLAETILVRTGGNPFFIEEVVRGLFDADVLVEQDGVLLVDSGAAPRVPATVQELLAAHLDRLPASARRVLQPAAVIGPTFWERVLERILSDPDLQPQLATLEWESLILSQPEQVERTYMFRHALIQEVAYQGQLQSQRRVMHEAVGGALETLYPERLDELTGELAFHYGRSDNDAKALQWLVRAGDRAARLYANQEALTYYTSALGRARDGEGAVDAGTILERIGDIQHLVGQYDEAIGSFRSARERIPLPRPVPVARLLRKIGTALRIHGVYPEAAATFSEALDLVENENDIEAAQVRLQIGQLHWRAGEYALAQEALAKAVEIATALKRVDVLAEGLKQLGNIPLFTGDPQQAIPYYQRSQSLYEQLEDTRGIAGVRMNLGAVYGRMGRWDECQAELDASLALHTRIGDRWHIGVVYNNLAELHRMRGEPRAATKRFEQALALFREIGDAAWCASVLTGLGMARIDGGEVQQGRADLLQAERQFSALGRSMYLPDIYRSLASAELAMGNLDAARRYAERSIDFARAANARHQEAMTQRVMGEIHLAQGGVGEARRLLEASRRTLAEVGEAGELARTEAILKSLPPG